MDGVKRKETGWNVSWLAQVGAVLAAIVASACCWLPLTLVAFGATGGALSATFEQYRLLFLAVTFLALGAAFYFTYRPRRAVAGGNDADEAGCAVPSADGQSETCCPPAGAKGFTAKRLNKVMLWVVASFVLAFAFFPNYVGFLIAGGGRSSLAADAEFDKLALQVEGMTCEGCAAILVKALEAPKVATEVIDAGSGEGVPIIDFANLISDMTGAKIEHLPMRKGETSKAVIRGDVATLDKWLGGHTFTSLDEGIKKTVDWYKKHYKELI